jgi:16S rRNA (cytosine1402-N4)-methyltransferase
MIAAMKLSDKNNCTSAGYHAPVMSQEVLEAYAPAEGRLVVDCTLGGGGHSELLLEAGASVIGIDQDPEAIAFASNRLARFGDRFRAVRANFSQVGQVLGGFGLASADGFLLDLGVSSHQLDTPERGFSFRFDGPLDMRMSPELTVTAADWVNTASSEQLERMFREYGEEPQARRIARGLVKERAVRPFRTTLDLAEGVERVVPRRGRTHPATQVFQALRIAVNRELEVLEQTLAQLGGLLAEGGRLAIITFHSLEDRIVKQVFQRCSTPTIDRPEWPAPRRNPDCIYRKLTGKPVVAGAAEQRSNPRSRSAKLRVVERLPSVRVAAIAP